MKSGDMLEANSRSMFKVDFFRIGWHRAALISLVLSLLAIAQRRIPLGHDESVYALRGHDLRTGYSYLSGDYWLDYRAPGLSFIDSWLFSMFGENDFVARFPSMAFGLILCLSTFLLAREMFGKRISEISAVLFVATPVVVVNSSLLLADVPGAAVSVICVYLVFYLQRKEANWFSIMASIFVLGTLATLLRFGSFITYGPGVFAASVYALLSFNGDGKWSKFILKHVLLQVVSLLSFVWIYFTHLTSMNGSSPYQANTNIITVIGNTPFDALVDLVELVNPFSNTSVWINVPFGVLIICTFLLALAKLSSPSPLRSQAICIFVAGLISLGLMIFGIKQVQGNYLALSAPYWILLSAVGLHQLHQHMLARHKTQFLRVFPPKVIVILGTSLLTYLPVHYYFTNIQNKVSVSYGYGVRFAGEEIALEVAGEKCIVLSSYPQSAWYSKCLLVAWFETSEDNPKQGAEGDDFGQIAKDTIGTLDLARWQTMRNFQDLDEYRKFVVLVVKGKRQPSEMSIENDQFTLLEKMYTTERVFYAEIDGSAILKQ